MDKIIGIYCIKNKITDKKYIGSSINIHRRFNQHKYKLNNKTHDNPKLQRDWEQYGKDNFEFFVLEKCTEKSLTKKEQKNINYFDTINNGYNCAYAKSQLIRSVAYLKGEQSEYVRKMAKKHKVKESEIIRIAINMLMKG